MSSPPEGGPRPPLLVRYLLGNVRTRGAALWLVVATGIFVLVALALQDPVLVGIAVIGVVAYLFSIVWMDRNGGWTAPAGAAGSPDAEVAPPALTPGAAPDAVDGSSRSGAIESLRRASFDDVATAAGIALERDPALAPSGAAPRAFAALIVAATVTFLGALIALESGGDDPHGAHLVEVILDALFGLGFGAFGLVVTLQRDRLPGRVVLSVAAAGGLGLVAGLGYFVANGLAAVHPEGPGILAAWLIGTAASGAGVWLAATSGSRAGLLAAVLAVLIGWSLGFAAWIAHINAV